MLIEAGGADSLDKAKHMAKAKLEIVIEWFPNRVVVVHTYLRFGPVLFKWRNQLELPY